MVYGSKDSPNILAIKFTPVHVDIVYNHRAFSRIEKKKTVKKIGAYRTMRTKYKKKTKPNQIPNKIYS